MPNYRFYPIRPDGHIAGAATDRDLPDDAAALKEARQMVDGLDVEVWCDARIVAYVTPDDEMNYSDGEPPSRHERREQEPQRQAGRLRES